MSSRKLEEQQEREQDLAVAAAISISVQELDELNYILEPCEDDDGLLYGYNVYFSEGSNQEILFRISGLNDGRWVRIGPDL